MLTQESLKLVLERLRRGLESIYGPRLRGAYLFGSYARGEAEAESDLDVLIVLDRVNDYWAEIQRASELGASLSIEWGVTITKVFVPEREWLSSDSPFLANVRGEAVAA